MAILAMSILLIVTALTNTEKVRRQSQSGFLKVVDPPPVCPLTEGFDHQQPGWHGLVHAKTVCLLVGLRFQGNPEAFINRALNSHIAADFNNGSDVATIITGSLPQLSSCKRRGVDLLTRTVTPDAFSPISGAHEHERQHRTWALYERRRFTRSC